MANVAPYINGFPAGMVSPYLHGRVNSESYGGGAELIENCFVLPEACVVNRGGTEFIAPAKFSNKQCRLITFTFNRLQAYTLELGDLYCRFFTDDAPVVEASKSISAITNANPGVVTSAAHGYTNGQELILSSIGGMVELEGRRVRVSGAATNTYQLQDTDGNSINTAGYGTYTSGGISERIYEIVTPWAEAELFELQYTQSADIMYIVHQTHKPRKLSRSGATNWTVANYAPTADPFNATDDYPGAVAFYEQRLVFANTNNNPLNVWFSKAGDYENMTTGTNDADGMVYTIATREINAINWLFAEQFLLIGTDGGAFVARGTGYDEAITPTNILIKRQLSFAASKELPVLVEDLVLFLNRVKQKIYAAALDGSKGKYYGRDATVRVRGLMGGGLSQLTYQEEPYGIAFAVRNDGLLCGMTLNGGENIAAWQQFRTLGSVESITVTPDSTEDKLWLSVNRTINGIARRYIERLVPHYDTLETAFYVDSGLIYEGTATDEVAGLEHLEGQSVAILADGAVHPSQTVTNGRIDLETDATRIVVGLPYAATGKTLKLEGGSQNGSSQGKRKKISRVDLRLYKSSGVKIGTQEDRLQQIPFREISTPLGDPPALFTGDKEVRLGDGWNKDGQIIFRQDLPLPMTVLGMALRLSVVDG